MRILFLTDQMAIGGAGRVASILICGLSENGHDIALETDLNREFLYKVPSSVKLFPRKHDQGIFHRLKKHRQYIRDFHPDLIIAFLPSMFLDIWIASIGLKIPIIASDHTSMGRDLGLFTNYLRHHFYSLAKAVTILTEKDKRLLGKRLPNKIVIYNPLTFTPLTHPEAIKRNCNILIVGRLKHWKVKGIDRIIEIWSHLFHEFPEWTLDIAGPGDDDSISQINDMIRTAGISNSVRLLGNIPEMDKLYQQSSIFALPSRVEGFPMVLTEAMSQGCACISFRLDGAINEIIDNGTDGIIIPDNNLIEFESKLKQLMSDSHLRNVIAKNAINSVTKFSKELFIDKWEKLITDVTS